MRIVSYIIAFALGILTAVAALFAMCPWLTVSELETTEPGDPFTLRFRFKNEGLLPVQNIKVKCTVFSIKAPSGSQIVETSFEDFEDVRHALKPKHQTSLACAPAVEKGRKVSKAALAISVSFEPYYLPWEWRREEPPFVYTLERGEDNRIIWLPEG